MAERASVSALQQHGGSGGDAAEAVRRLAGRWEVVPRPVIGGSVEHPLHLDFALLHPFRGVALVDLAPKATAHAVASLRLALEAGEMDVRHPGLLPIVYCCLAPEEVPLLPRLLDAALATQRPLTVADAGWTATVRTLLAAGPSRTAGPSRPAGPTRTAGPVGVATGDDRRSGLARVGAALLLLPLAAAAAGVIAVGLVGLPPLPAGPAGDAPLRSEAAAERAWVPGGTAQVDSFGRDRGAAVSAHPEAAGADAVPRPALGRDAPVDSGAVGASQPAAVAATITARDAPERPAPVADASGLGGTSGEGPGGSMASPPLPTGTSPAGTHPRVGTPGPAAEPALPAAAPRTPEPTEASRSALLPEAARSEPPRWPVAHVVPEAEPASVQGDPTRGLPGGVAAPPQRSETHPREGSVPVPADALALAPPSPSSAGEGPFPSPATVTTPSHPAASGGGPPLAPPAGAADPPPQGLRASSPVETPPALAQAVAEDRPQPPPAFGSGGSVPSRAPLDPPPILPAAPDRPAAPPPEPGPLTPPTRPVGAGVGGAQESPAPALEVAVPLPPPPMPAPPGERSPATHSTPPQPPLRSASQPRAGNGAVAETAAPRQPASPRCAAILARLQLGETPSHADRTHVQTVCAPRP